jgi:hypothetical protein
MCIHVMLVGAFILPDVSQWVHVMFVTAYMSVHVMFVTACMSVQH